MPDETPTVTPTPPRPRKKKGWLTRVLETFWPPASEQPTARLVPRSPPRREEGDDAA